MTGITRVSRESVFSDLNNLEVVTTTSRKYASSFGFTEEEVFAALDQYGLGDSRQGSKTVKQDFEELLSGHALETEIDEQIVYNCLDTSEKAIWSLLLASGYLKVKEIRTP